jgi:hypothetical protein
MKRDLVFFIGALLFAIVLGGLIGEIHGRSWTFGNVVPLVISDTRPRIPTVTIQDISDGIIHGHVTDHVRIFGGDHAVVTSSGAFSIPLTHLTKIVAVTIPAGMKFVASKNGKKYYPVSSPSGSRIALKNRVYFASAEDAEKAGFKK